MKSAPVARVKNSAFKSRLPALFHTNYVIDYLSIEVGKNPSECPNDIAVSLILLSAQFCIQLSDTNSTTSSCSTV